MKMIWRLLNTAAIAAMAATTPAPFVGGAPAVADELESDAKVRVNLSGRQRMLTQRMSKAACMMALGVEQDMHATMVKTAHSDFDKALKALHVGDTELGVIGEEVSSRVLRGLAEVETHWEAFGPAVAGMISSGTYGGAALEKVFAENVTLLREMNEAVSLIEQVHANPNEMLLAQAVAINIAGRQRMLSQKIGKEFCQLNLGWNTDATREALVKTIDMFESSHAALANGMPEVGIIKPPTDEIRSSLEALEVLWQDQRAMIDRVMAGESLSAEEMSRFAKENDQMLKDMHAIVGMYVAA